jgi:hypothetical protein
LISGLPQKKSWSKRWALRLQSMQGRALVYSARTLDAFTAKTSM